MYGQMSKQISNNSYFMHIVGISQRMLLPWLLWEEQITKKKLILKNRKEAKRKKWPSYVNTNFILSNFHNFEIFSWLETHFIHQIFMLFMPEYSIPLIERREGWILKYKRFFIIIERTFLCVKVFWWLYKNLLLWNFVLELSQNKSLKWHFYYTLMNIRPEYFIECNKENWKIEKKKFFFTK